MRELRYIDCGRVLPSALETFGDLGQEKCQLCYLYLLDRLDADETDEYLPMIYLDMQDEETLPCVTLLGQSTQLLF